MQTPNNERFFSIELNSKNHIKTISITKDSQKETALIEGSIGTFIEATFNEGVILEVIGTKGTLRLDLHSEEIKNNSKNGEQ
jgi:hypothetical protein